MNWFMLTVAVIVSAIIGAIVGIVTNRKFPSEPDCSLKPWDTIGPVEMPPDD